MKLLPFFVLSLGIRNNIRRFIITHTVQPTNYILMPNSLLNRLNIQFYIIFKPFTSLLNDLNCMYNIFLKYK